jgi:uncharacterized protein (DUF433 family)
MMIQTPISLEVPLRTDEDGVIRVGNGRVTLATIVGAYNRGDTPQEIHDGFDTVPLADVHAIIAYYLNNRVAVDAYIVRTKAEAEAERRAFEAEYPELVEKQKRFLERVKKLREEK